MILTAHCIYENETVSEFLVKYNRLYDHIFSNYRKELPPVYSRARFTYENFDNSKRTEFIIKLYYAKLLSLYEPDQIVTMIVEYDLTWFDARLSWNVSQWDDIQEIILNREKIWVPDVLPYDTQYLNDPREEDQQNIYVNFMGRATYFVVAVMAIVCPLDVKYAFSTVTFIKIAHFPYDIQHCEMNMVSNNFQPVEVVIWANLFEGFDTESTSNGVWNCDYVAVTVLETSSNDTDWNYEVAKYTFTFRRSAQYYILIIIIPFFVMTMLCVIGIFWTSFEPESQSEKLSLGFAAILAMAMVLQISADSIPKTAQVPILSFYIIFNLMLVTLASLVALIASKLSSMECCILQNSAKRQRNKLGVWISVRLHRICLVVFPTLSIINSMILVLYL